MPGPNAEFVAKLTSEFLGASESIDVLAPAAWFEFGVPIDDILCTVDSRLRLRCVLGPNDLDLPTVIEAAGSDDPADDSVEAGLRSLGWKVKLLDRPPTVSCFVFDGSEAVIFDHAAYRDGEQHFFVEDDIVSVNPIVEHFSDVFETGRQSVLLYEDLVSTIQPAKAAITIEQSSQLWDRIIRELQIDPERVRNLSPRQFEEFVAELLHRKGLSVQLTPEKADGGFDILAQEHGPIGHHLYLVECKRYDWHRPVGVEIVRSLYGVVESQSATAGVIVTTSTFTRGARSFRDVRRHRLELHDYQALVKWLRNE